jgi:hypothetical protein
MLRKMQKALYAVCMGLMHVRHSWEGGGPVDAMKPVVPPVHPHEFILIFGSTKQTTQLQIRTRNMAPIAPVLPKAIVAANDTEDAIIAAQTSVRTTSSDMGLFRNIIWGFC